MESFETVSLISLAFGLGIIHALDADHIIAVSGLASTRVNRRDSVRFCLRWALGHSASLLIIGSAVFLLGFSIPHEISYYAGSMVGIVLISIGLLIGWQLIRNNAHLHVHQHDDMPPHAHWHTHQHKSNNHHLDAHRHRHTAVLVGLLHGAAGSAPLLVLIPLARLESPWLGMLYLLIFSTAVLLAMLVFGGVLGSVYQWLSRWGSAFVKSLKAIIASGSIGYGSYLVASHWAS